MRKGLFILSLMGVMLLTACSSENDLAISHELTPEEKAAILAEANKDSEVPIQLGFSFSRSAISMTRSPLNSEAGMFTTPAGKYLGVFCLAQKPQAALASPGPVAEDQIDWTASATNLTYLMNPNQPAQVLKKDGSNTIGTASTEGSISEVSFMDPTTLGSTPTKQHYYYPDASWYNYHFYAYYPRQNSNVTVAPKKVTVDFALDGTQDVLWTKAVPATNGGSDVDNGFNADYFSSQLVNGVNAIGDFPELDLTHNLTMLKFWVRCKDPKYTLQHFTSDQLQLTGIKIVDIPMNWTLTVADRENPSNEGTLTHTNLTLTNELNVWHENGDGTDTEALSYAGGAINVPYIQGSTTPTYVGYVMIPTTAMMDAIIADGLDIPKNPFVKLTVNEKGTVYEMTPKMVTLPDNGSFEATKIYNVYLSIPIQSEGGEVELNAGDQSDPGLDPGN
jgi:hypothetical protein